MSPPFRLLDWSQLHTNQPDDAHINPTAHKSTRRHTYQPDSTQINPTAHKSTRQHTNQPYTINPAYQPCGTREPPCSRRRLAFSPAAHEATHFFHAQSHTHMRPLQPRGASARLPLFVPFVVVAGGCVGFIVTASGADASCRLAAARLSSRAAPLLLCVVVVAGGILFFPCISTLLHTNQPDYPQINPTTHTMCPSRSGAAKFAAARTEQTHRINPATHTDTRSP